MRIKNLAQTFIVITLLAGCMAKLQPVSNSIEAVEPIVFIKHANSGARASLSGGKLHVLMVVFGLVVIPVHLLFGLIIVI